MRLGRVVATVVLTLLVAVPCMSGCRGAVGFWGIPGVHIHRCVYPAPRWPCAASFREGKQRWTCSGSQIFRCDDEGPKVVQCAVTCVVHEEGKDAKCEDDDETCDGS